MLTMLKKLKRYITISETKCFCCLLYYLWGVILIMIPEVSSANEITSENQVGYEVVSLKKGESRIFLPPKPSGQLVSLSEFLDMGALKIGDSVKVQSQSGEVMLAKVIEKNNKKHGFVSGVDGCVDSWILPFEGARQILDVYRTDDVVTKVTRSGEYGYGNVKPEVYPVHYSGVPVGELKISKATAVALQGDKPTTPPKINFPTMIPKKFEMILKDGSRHLVMVNSKTRILEDAKSGVPVNVDIGDISGFSEATTNSVEQTERADEKEVAAVAKEVSKAAKDYDTWQAIRKGIVGEVWDSVHPWKSVITAVVVIGVIQLIGKAWDWFFAYFSLFLFWLCRCVRKGVALLRILPRKNK